MCNSQSFRPISSVKIESQNFDTYVCPKCGYPQYCGCPSCKDKMPNGIRPYRWKTVRREDNTEIELCICANCGHEATVDWWTEQELKQYKQELTK